MPSDPQALAPSNALQRRLRTGVVPAGVQPTPEMADDQGPAFASGAEQQPAAQIHATPLVDPKQLMAEYDDLEKRAQPRPGTLRTAVGRALYGFARGIQATPATAGYSPILGGIEGGLAGAGEVAEQQRREEIARQNSAMAPRRLFLQALSNQSAKSAVEDRYQQAEEARRQAGHARDIRLRADLTRQMMDDQSAQKAKEKGISVEDYMKLRKSAISNAMAQGLDFDSPGYQGFIDQEVNRLATSAKSLGNQGLTPKPQSAPAARPKTAAEYLQGLSQ